MSRQRQTQQKTLLNSSSTPEKSSFLRQRPFSETVDPDQLPLPTQIDRATRFGHNFSHVQVHESTPCLGAVSVQTKLEGSQPDEAVEQEADAVVERVVAGEAVQAQDSPPLLVARSPWDWIEETASDAWGGIKDTASAVGDVASDAWDLTKEVGGDIYGGMKTAAGYVKQGEQAFDHGVDWLEGKASSGAHWLADKADGIPVLEQVTDAGAWLVDQQAQLTGGALKGAGTLVGGVLGMAANPVDTAKGLYTMGEHIPIMGGLVPNPLKAAHGLYDVVANDQDMGEVANRVFNPYQSMQDDAAFGKNLVQGIISPYEKSIEEGKYSEAIGRGIFDIGSIVLTAGGGAAVEGAAGAGRVAGIAGEVADVARGAEVATVASEAARGAEVATVAGEAARGAEVGDAAKLVSEMDDAAKVASEVDDAAKVASEVDDAAKVASEVDDAAKVASEVDDAAKVASPKPSRVSKPGGQPEKHKFYETNERVPEHYRDDPRFNELASDPDHAGEINPNSRGEAMAGLEAESQGLMTKPIERGPKGIEFYDAEGVPYDVKRPPSPPPGARWKFKPKQSGNSLLEQVRTDFPNKLSNKPEAVKVILDSAYMTEADHAALWKYLTENATKEELERIIELNTQH